MRQKQASEDSQGVNERANKAKTSKAVRDLDSLFFRGSLLGWNVKDAVIYALKWKHVAAVPHVLRWVAKLTMWWVVTA